MLYVACKNVMDILRRSSAMSGAASKKALNHNNVEESSTGADRLLQPVVVGKVKRPGRRTGRGCRDEAYSLVLLPVVRLQLVGLRVRPQTSGYCTWQDFGPKRRQLSDEAVAQERRGNCLGTKSFVAVLVCRGLLVILHILGNPRRKNVEDRE